MSAPLNDPKLTVPMDDAKQSITSLSMFYFQSLRDAGYSVADSKKRVADLLKESYEHYCDIGNIPTESLGGIESKLNGIITSVHEIAKTNPSLRNVYSQLVSLRASIAAAKTEKKR